MLSALKKQLHKEHRASRTGLDSTSLSGAEPATAEATNPPAASPASQPPLPPLSLADRDRLEAVGQINPRLYSSLQALDSAQLAAVLSEEESLLVRAPVGSGKTTVLVHKVLYLHFVCGVPLQQMVVLTFTNRAAAEIRARIEAIAERQLTRQELWRIGTFHGVARALLAHVLPIEQLGYQTDFTILEPEAVDALHDTLIRSERLRIGRRSSLRQRLRELAEGKPASSADLARLAALCTTEKLRRNAMDFDDLIAHATTLLAAGAETAAAWLIVDEMQDCEPRELALLKALRGAGTRFFAVGDPHQAIYGFRGSAPAVFRQAETAFSCQALVLPVNYRSTRTILDSARAVLGLQPAEGRDPGGLRAARSFGERLLICRHHDPISESLYLADRIAALHASGVAYHELAVLFRLRAQAEPIRAALTARQIPCSEPEPQSEAAHDAVRLLTLHAAKGLEFRHVFLSGINDGLLPLGPRFDIDAEAEERRLLFVGLTRARDCVEISYHSRPHEVLASAEPSPYLAWIPAALVTWDKGVGACSLPRGELRNAAPPESEAAPPASVAVTSAAAPAASPWQPGQTVRHPRYGAGIVCSVTADSVHCTFGKFGERSFPLALCPLQPGAPTPSESISNRSADPKPPYQPT